MNKSDARIRAGTRRLVAAAFPGLSRGRCPRERSRARCCSKDALFSLCPWGDQMYPEDYYTDQTPDFRIAEIVREKAMLQTREEVPAFLYVRMEDLEMRDGGGHALGAGIHLRGAGVAEGDSRRTGRRAHQGHRAGGPELELSEIFPWK